MKFGIEVVLKGGRFCGGGVEPVLALRGPGTLKSGYINILVSPY